MSTKQESRSDAAFRHGHFYPILILPVKMVELSQQHANTTVHWFQALPLPIVAKSSILNVTEFLDPSLKTSPCTKTSSVSYVNQYFLSLFRNFANFIESQFVFLCYFSQYYEVFFISLLDSCYYYQITCKEVNFIKK